MKKVLFACDLDNTLLFSRRHAGEGDLCVEYLEGTPQGYLPWETPRALGALMERLLFIPVTSRSVEQYRRIQFPAACRPRYAVAANGGILLSDGEIDRPWREASLEAVRPWREALEAVTAEMGGQPQARRVRVVDQLYGFAACDGPEEALALRETLRGRTPLELAVSGRKLYALPPPVNKGAAVARLKRRFQADALICAGDSAMDIPMLELADLAIVPGGTGLGDIACRRKAVCGQGEGFGSFVLRTAAQYLDA